MGWLGSEKPPAKWNAGWFKLFVERLRTAINFLDVNNFPEGISGVLLQDKTVSLSKLYGLEFQHSIIAQATPYTTTATTLENVGGYLVWDNIWGDAVELKFEVTGSSSNAAATATFELHGAGGKLAEVTTALGTPEMVRSQPFNPPAETQTLLVKMMTSNASYAAQILSARLIITIK